LYPNFADGFQNSSCKKDIFMNGKTTCTPATNFENVIIVPLGAKAVEIIVNDIERIIIPNEKNQKKN
jgi:hypothetical protein